LSFTEHWYTVNSQFDYRIMKR